VRVRGKVTDAMLLHLVLLWVVPYHACAGTSHTETALDGIWQEVFGHYTFMTVAASRAA